MIGGREGERQMDEEIDMFLYRNDAPRVPARPELETKRKLRAKRAAEKFLGYRLPETKPKEPLNKGGLDCI
jgi:hypothetical protein